MSSDIQFPRLFPHILFCNMWLHCLTSQPLLQLYCASLIRPVSSVVFFYVPGHTKFPTAIVSKYRWPAKWKLRVQCHANRRHLWTWQATTSSSYPISYSHYSWFLENIRLYIYILFAVKMVAMIYTIDLHKSIWNINIIPGINISLYQYYLSIIIILIYRCSRKLLLLVFNM